MNNAIPFSAAIFDLDGTLLDSLGVWQDVDRAFFAARGIPLPEDYGRAMQGRSFRECAEYTVERFRLPESPEAVMEEWMRMTADEYAHAVALTRGARDYLRTLRRAGVKLAVATANRRPVFEPCLERCGILELFDAVCTTGDIGDRGKGDGALFLRAAERLG
ncbi:MAG: HAD family phosphatase, partial [Clostridia bacterium]|nr:HAD family phosphatase [Clostridia bacterium]